MRVLVTGGAGYIGSAVVYRLLGDGHDVKVVDLLVRGGHALLAACREQRFEMVLGDVCDPDVAADAVAGCDAIVHLAAVVGTPACERAPEAAVAVNVGATASLLAARGQQQRFVFASTESVYGEVLSGYCDEDTVPEPATRYGRTKLTAERMVSEAGNSVIMRLATVFGVSGAMRWDALVNSLTLQAVATGTVTLYQPDVRRSFIHVDDVSRALCLPIQAWSGESQLLVNVGDSRLTVTKRELVSTICEQTGAKQVVSDAGQDPDKRDYVMSFDKITKLGFSGKRSLETGVEELVKAARLCDGTSACADH